MKEGKVTQAVLDRSILRPLRLAGVLAPNGPAYGVDATTLIPSSLAYGMDTAAMTSEDQLSETETSAWKWSSLADDTNVSIVSASNTGTVGGTQDLTPEMIILGVANNLACRGGEMDQITVSILFPEDREEAELKQLICDIGGVCRRYGIRINGGHTQVSSAILRPVLSVTGIAVSGFQYHSCSQSEREGVLFSGSKKSEGSSFLCGKEKNGSIPQRILPDQELVMAGYAGMAGTALLAWNREKELRKRYPPALIDRAKQFADHLSVWEAAKIGLCDTSGNDMHAAAVSSMHDVAQGGVYGALWEMAEGAGVGLEIDLKKIPILQETIEICEFFDLNPYQLYGQGALLLATNCGDELVCKLEKKDIPAAVIGRFTEGKGRTIRNGEDSQCLNRPGQDALWWIEAGTQIITSKKRSVCESIT